jgi:hypothetical protein
VMLEHESPDAAANAKNAIAKTLNFISSQPLKLSS